LKAEKKRRIDAEEARRRTAERADEIREKCKSFAGFIDEAWHVLEPTTAFKNSWHISALADHLEAVTRGDIHLLQINVPPGCSKSLVASVMHQAYEWGPANKPGLRYFTASYNEELARTQSRKARNLIQSEWYRVLWPSIVLTRDAETNFENTFYGNRQAVPFGSLTGGRGNRVIIDDPHSTKTAESDQTRREATLLFRESVPSRVNDIVNDAIIVIMQRLHPEDVCGVIDELGLPYTKLIIPMEYTRSLSVKTPWFEDPRTEEGELMDPARFPRREIEQHKITLGPHAYDTQYQQQPKARAGSYYFDAELFLIGQQVGTNEAPRIEHRPAPMPTVCDAVFAVIDTASKTERRHDGTGVVFCAYTKFPKPSLVAIEWAYSKIEASMLTQWIPGILRRGEELAKICKARNGWLYAYVEDKDSGIALIQHAQRAGWRVKPIPSEITAMGKDGRALSVSGYINNGLFKIAQPAYDFTSTFNGRLRNHFFYQLTNFRMKMGTPDDEDEMFDCGMYSVALAFGDKKGF
jgi:hypothetical protein